jgi:hypothetical protein
LFERLARHFDQGLAKLLEYKVFVIMTRRDRTFWKNPTPGNRLKRQITGFAGFSTGNNKKWEKL